MAARTEYRQFRFRRPPGACEILLIRHGESAPAVPGIDFPRVEGQADPPLHDPDGVEQARQVCTRLAASGEEFGAVVVTPLQRTRQTAQPLLDRLGIEPLVEPDLREVFLGDLDGEGWRRASAEGAEVVMEVFTQQRWDVIPNAEGDAAFTARVRGAIERIADDHPDSTVAVFTHGGVVAKVMALATGSRNLAFIGTDNASVSHVVVTPEQWFIRAWNDTGHLTPRFSTDPEPLV